MSSLSMSPYHSEYCYALIRIVKGGPTEMCYRLAPSVKDLWAAVIEEEFLGTGKTAAILQREGWKARKIAVSECGD